jgi:hypothetical protein
VYYFEVKKMSMSFREKASGWTVKVVADCPSALNLTPHISGWSTYEFKNKLAKYKHGKIYIRAALTMNIGHASSHRRRSLLRWRDLEVEANVDPVVGDRSEHPHIIRAQKLRITKKF